MQMQRRKRYQTGSVTLDPRSNTWFFRWYERGIRKAERIGIRAEFPTKSRAMQAAEGIRLRINAPVNAAVTVEEVVQRYILERMPKRHSTKRKYTCVLKVIRQSWGNRAMPLKPYEVEVWLKNLKSISTGKLLSPKSKAHIKHMLHTLHDVAMLWEHIPVDRNPMSLMRVEGAGRRQKEPIILTMKEFRKLLTEVNEEPYKTMVLLTGCLGLRISEVLGLRWEDFDWQNSEVGIERGVVEGRTDELKTKASRKRLPLNEALVKALQGWKQQTQFPRDDDYVRLRSAKNRCRATQRSATGSSPPLSGRDWVRLDGTLFATAIAHGWRKRALLSQSKKNSCATALSA